MDKNRGIEEVLTNFKAQKIAVPFGGYPDIIDPKLGKNGNEFCRNRFRIDWRYVSASLFFV
jgi:hypothetical protein